MRTFIAISLDSPLLERVTATIERARSELGDRGFRWVRPEAIHLTLRFLGQTTEAQLRELTHGLDEIAAGVTGLQLTVDGLGCFPNVRRPRVLWLGVGNPNGRLSSLQAAIENSVQRLGFEPEPRAFHPHLTIARIKSRMDLTRSIENVGVEQIGEMVASQVDLIESELHPGGARHRLLHSSPLKGETV